MGEAHEELGCFAGVKGAKFVEIGEDGIVEGPELPLGACRLGRLGGHMRFVVDVDQREVAINHLHFVGVSLDQLLEHRANGRASWALEVGILDNG